MDLFIIFLILAGGAAGFWAWRSGRISFSGFSTLMPGKPPGSRPVSHPGEALDAGPSSAWVQSRVRELLHRHGMAEKNILKVYNAQRDEGGVRWLEDTLELRRPRGFGEKAFLKDVAVSLAEKRFFVMEDRLEDARWILSLGDGRRVYQRLIFIK